MPDFLLSLFRMIWMLTKGHRALALENLALRQQLAIFKRRRKRPRLNRSDRVFWMVLAKVWKDWRQALVVVHPDTVVRWQRRRFRRYWANLSVNFSGKLGRPSVGQQIRDLIHTIAHANPLWRAPRIHGELAQRSLGNW